MGLCLLNDIIHTFLFLIIKECAVVHVCEFLCQCVYRIRHFRGIGTILSGLVRNIICNNLDAVVVENL